MLTPKIACAVILDRLTPHHKLDAFVLFSSTTAHCTVRGMAHYAAANVCLDAIAHCRRAAGPPAVSINWGTWDVMRLATQTAQAAFLSIGLLPMESGRAIDTMSTLAAGGPPQATVAAIDWRPFKSVYEAR